MNVCGVKEHQEPITLLLHTMYLQLCVFRREFVHLILEVSELLQTQVEKVNECAHAVYTTLGYVFIKIQTLKERQLTLTDSVVSFSTSFYHVWV